MKICLVSNSFSGFAGAESVVRALGNELCRRGHEVLAVTYESPKDEGEADDLQFRILHIQSTTTEKYAQRENFGILYRAFWRLRCLKNAYLVGKLQDTIAGFSPDVIHTHKVQGFPGNTWTALGKVHCGTLVHTCHDNEVLSPYHAMTVRASGFFTAQVLKWWSGKFIQPSRRVDVVTAPSVFTLNQHRVAGLFPDAKFELVPNFPNLPMDVTPSALEPGDTSAPLRVVFLGRLEPAKGVLDLCHSVKDLVSEGHKIQLKIAGSGSLEPSLVQFAEEHPFIRFLGVVREHQKFELLDWGQVVAVPSRCDESFGLVAVEAMTAGRPVLASNRGGLPEVVTAGETGWIYTGKGIDAISAGLKILLENPAQVVDFSANSLVSARRFAKVAAIDLYERLYHEHLVHDQQPGGNLLPNHTRLLGLPFDPGLTESQVMDTLLNRPTLLTYLNPFAWKVARTNGRYARDLARFDLVVCDGIAVRSACWSLLGIRTDVLTPDSSGMANAYFSLFLKTQQSICMVGGHTPELLAARARLEREFPGISIVNAFSGFDDGPARAKEFIQATKPDVVIAGMGMGKQERFLLDCRQAGWSGTGLCVGAFFERLAQPGRDYPSWAIRYKLKWVSNILQKPFYYLRRYGVDYLPFMRLYLSQYLNRTTNKG